MSAELLCDRPDARVYHATWAELLAVLPRRDDGTVCDALIVDAPYSEKTHSGHDGGDRYDGSGVVVDRGDASYGHRRKTRAINYEPWSQADVDAFVCAWAPSTRGWFCSITDDVLAPAWRASLEAVGRYAFAPVPIVEIGSRVRLVGDGPSSWSCYLIAARPANGAWLEGWRDARRSINAARALPGAYVYTGHGDREVMGGKRTDCMEAIVRDYSQPGELVADPCCGGGTTLLAAIMNGRAAVGGDALREHAELAADRVGRRMVQRPLFAGWGG